MSYGITAARLEPAFVDLARRAGTLCGVPMAAIGFRISEREWAKAPYGFEEHEIAGLAPFCATALDSDLDLVVVRDAARHPGLSTNPLVAGDRSIRLFASVPVRSPDGLVVGTVSIFDTEARDLSPWERDGLAVVAREVESELAARRVARDVALALRNNGGPTISPLRGLGAAALAAPVGMLLVDMQGSILEINPVFADMLGCSREELIGSSIHAHTVAKDIETEWELLAEVLANKREQAIREKRYLKPDGTSVLAISNSVLIKSPEGAPCGFLSWVESIEQRRAAEEFLLEAESASDALLTIDQAGRITSWNTGASRIFGRTESEMIGRGLDVLVPEVFRESHREFISQAARSGIQRGTMKIEVSALGPDGQEFPAEVTLTEWLRGGKRHFTALVRDISERKSLEAELLARANIDTLTGLAGRSMLTSSLATALANCAPVSVVALDVYRFGQLNITLGPSAADRILVEIGRILSGVLRDDDLLGRVGGDEFAAVLPNTSATAAAGIAKRFHDALHEAAGRGRLPVILEVRSGIASARARVGETRASGAAFRLLRNAQLALGEGSPGSIRPYRADLVRTARRRAQLHAALHQALERDELTIAYQVQRDLAEDRIVAVEALARWNDPKVGEVSPEEFIPIAEDTGLIQRLGAWVLDTACRRAARWRTLSPGPFSLSVNASGRQLADDGIIEAVEKALGRSGLPASALTLEVTESVLMADVEGAARRLEALGDLGVRIAVDDFGTGYSNLASLSHFPIAELKIDRSFVTPLPGSSSAVKVVTTILSLADSLGLNTVAEGVETVEQGRLLGELGCQTGQGYLFGRPVPPEEIDRIFPENPTVVPMVRQRRSG